jgi:hypothetical protein
MRVTAPLELPSRVERCPYLDELPWVKSRNTLDSDGTGLVLLRSAELKSMVLNTPSLRRRSDEA